MAEDATLESCSVEALVSMKEGSAFPVTMTPPKRGHPARIRKPNPRIFGDDEEESRAFLSRPKKTPKVATPKGVLTTPDKKAAQAIGVRLRNLLKLPKAHKWVCYEWFYSNIDLPLFEGENDFCICLRESFPQLKTKKLRRAEWCKIRRLMGKPRRCSAAFFNEERAVLNAKRAKIRLLQQRKVGEVQDLKDLPEEIPMPLVIGTKVTARLRRPQDGLFTGVIDALDTVNNTYRVTFDRPGLGTHSIPDCEVLSNEPQETMPLSAFQAKQRPNRLPIVSPQKFLSGMTSPTISENDPLLGGSPLKNAPNLLSEGSTYGGFPVKFLVLVTRLTKILAIKKEKVKELRDMNTDAEKAKSYGKSLTTHFQKKYAAVVLELEQLNKDLNEYLVGVQQFCNEIAPEQGVPLCDGPTETKRKCDAEAEEIVGKTNCQQGRKMVQGERMIELVTRLTSLLLQIKTFSENNMHSYELNSLQQSLNEIRSSLDHSNISSFQNNVEIHINHIQSGVTQMGNLSAFATTQLMPI